MARKKASFMIDTTDGIKVKKGYLLTVDGNTFGIYSIGDAHKIEKHWQLTELYTGYKIDNFRTIMDAENYLSDDYQLKQLIIKINGCIEYILLKRNDDITVDINPDIEKGYFPL